jgi:hypothetical protein
VKVTSKEHVSLPEVLEHVLLAIANSAAFVSENVKPVKLKTPPLMVRVSGALVTPLVTSPKLKVSGMRLTSVRHPERFTIWGLRKPPLEKFSLSTPMTEPGVPGPKVTSALQVACGARLPVQVLLLRANAPEAVRVGVSAELSVLVKVTVLAAEVLPL